MKHIIFIGLLLFGIFITSQPVISETDLEVYSNIKYGISFNIPRGIKLYTEENPGPLASQISSRDPLILVNSEFTEENINLKVSENLSEGDLIDFKKMLDEKPNMPLPKYQRISVGFINIGKQMNKKAVEHIFIMQGNILGKLRQVIFSHNKRGYTFTCATELQRFDKANQHFFNTVFNTMIFK